MMPNKCSDESIQLISLTEHATLLIAPIEPTNSIINRRASEQQAVRALLGTYFDSPNVELIHLPSGAPILPELPYNLSISHSDQWAGVLLTSVDYKAGLDLQRISDRLERVKDKFLSSDEQTLLLPITDQLNRKDRAINYTTLWSAKETAYKVIQPSDKSLSQSLTITEFSTNEQQHLTQVQIVGQTDSQSSKTNLTIESCVTIEGYSTTYCIAHSDPLIK